MGRGVASAYLLRGGAVARVGFVRHVRPRRSSDDAGVCRATSCSSEAFPSIDLVPEVNNWFILLRRSNASGATEPRARRWMPAIWRPNVGRVLPDVDVEVGVTEDASNKGTKRKRAPYTKGPCEHGVKPRSKCKVCGACPHGRQRYWCKECGGGSVCEHGRIRSTCKECGGSQICEHGRQRCSCKECGGASICEHGRLRSRCKECGGSGICEHARRRSECKECGGSAFCEHGRIRYYCKECGGSGICEHGRQRSQCKECGGSQICEHGRIRSTCKECHGSCVPVGSWVL